MKNEDGMFLSASSTLLIQLKEIEHAYHFALWISIQFPGKEQVWEKHTNCGRGEQPSSVINASTKTISWHMPFCSKEMHKGLDSCESTEHFLEKMIGWFVHSQSDIKPLVFVSLYIIYMCVYINIINMYVGYLWTIVWMWLHTWNIFHDPWYDAEKNTRQTCTSSFSPWKPPTIKKVLPCNACSPSMAKLSQSQLNKRLIYCIATTQK